MQVIWDVPLLISRKDVSYCILQLKDGLGQNVTSLDSVMTAEVFVEGTESAHSFNLTHETQYTNLNNGTIGYTDEKVTLPFFPSLFFVV